MYRDDAISETPIRSVLSFEVFIDVLPTGE